MIILTLKIWLLSLPYAICYFIVHSLQFDLRCAKTTVFYYSYTISMMNHYRTPSVDMIQSHCPRHSSVRAIVYVTRPIKNM